jgi:hypothetical protein
LAYLEWDRLPHIFSKILALRHPKPECLIYCTERGMDFDALLEDKTVMDD